MALQGTLATIDGAGTNSVKFGGGTATASGNNSIAIGYNSNAAGNYSTALGFRAIASGDYSTALGHYANASASGSTALGSQANASGYFSTALGYASKAFGDYSTALGQWAEAPGEGSIAIGSYTTSSVFPSPNAAGCYSIAIGTGARVNTNISTTSDTTIYPNYAIAIGYNSNAAGNYSTALGSWANVAGCYSIALGCSANASGDYSTDLGTWANASGNYSIALGRSANASGDYSIVLGSWAVASGNQSIALGTSVDASGGYSTALGAVAIASGNYSTALGRLANASYNFSIAIGYNAQTTALNTIMLGDSGTAGIYWKGGTAAHTSDIQDKINISQVENGALNFINQIEPVTYYYNFREDYQEREEWINQDIENIIEKICNLSKKERNKRYKYGQLGTYDKEEWAKGTKKKDWLSIGFKAQEIEQKLKEIYGDKYSNLIVSDICKDYTDEELAQDGAERQYNIAMFDMIPFLVKAIQELDARVQALEEELKEKV